MKLINLLSIQSKTLLKHNTHLAKNNKHRKSFLNKYILTTKSGIDLFNLQKVLTQLKTNLPLISTIKKKKGNIWIINKNYNWINGFLLNNTTFQKITKYPQYKKFPSFICITEYNKDKIESLTHEILTLKIPFTTNMNSDLNMQRNMYPVLTNTRNNSTNLHTNFIDIAIKVGILKELHNFSKKKFPRLDSNQ